MKAIRSTGRGPQVQKLIKVSNTWLMPAHMARGLMQKVTHHFIRKLLCSSPAYDIRLLMHGVPDEQAALDKVPSGFALCRLTLCLDQY